MENKTQLPLGLQTNWAISLFERGEWIRQPFVMGIGGSADAYEAHTGSGAHVRMEFIQETEADPRRCRSVYRITVRIGADRDGRLAGFKLHMPLDSSLRCSWKPHLAPESTMTISQKAFRSPAIIAEDGGRRIALIPDLLAMQEQQVIPHIMDYVLDDHEFYYGVCDTVETGHVYYELVPQPHAISEELVLTFYLVSWGKTADEEPRDFRAVEAFLWERFAGAEMALPGTSRELLDSLEVYPRYAYEWALDRWEDVCWQQFEIDGRKVGGVVFIVTARQKPGMGQEEAWREPKSLWNQAWFCGLRTAYGYSQAGQQYSRTDWIEKAEMALELALSAPQIDGLFPSYYQAGEDGSWESGGWQMSGPRRPVDHESYVHLLDASWTCYWLLKWYMDLRQDERIMAYVEAYVARLAGLQREDGGFPAWVNPGTSASSPYLTESPETAMHAMLFCMWAQVSHDHRYVGHAERACQYVLDRIVPQGRWEDFETYWSCSRQWSGKQYGVPDARSGLYNQCNFGIYWTAEALLMLSQVTGEQRWLTAGERVLAELSLYQQIWEPAFLPVPTLGGFGVMTSDDEWNDARQSLFALTYCRYYMMTGRETYLLRSIWAMKASFYMMYCPENPRVMQLYNVVHPHLDERDYGFHMENFNHHDGTSSQGLGEFTIFDWGCGAASAAYFEYMRLMGEHAQ